MGVKESRKIPYFRFGLQGELSTARALLTAYPLKARNKDIGNSQLLAANAIISNIPTGNRLIIRNFSDLKKEDRGFSRTIFLAVLIHFIRNKLILREGGEGFSRSEVTYSNSIKNYLPNNIAYLPISPIIINIKGEGRILAKISTEERRDLKKRLEAYWTFIKQHDICTGLTACDFKTFNDCETQVHRKPPLVEPRSTDKIPFIVFNNRDLTKGGRMYGPFWIGMKKPLRRGITIDGSKTCDIDGKGMHVQLLYQIAGEPLPEGDMYIHTDKRRRITKNLMLLMMNTSEEVSPEIGRKQVIRTYRSKFSKDDDGLEDYILELEGFHYKVKHLLYKPNWGRLHKTEAGIMLNIMEAGMKEGIVVLPVHDGCLCKIEDKDRVLQYFKDQNIEAQENIKHRLPVPLAEAKELLEKAKNYANAA